MLILIIYLLPATKGSSIGCLHRFPFLVIAPIEANYQLGFLNAAAGKMTLSAALAIVSYMTFIGV